VNVQYEKSYDSTDFNLNTETASSPMSDYLTLTDGSFEIHNSGGLVGTISYTAGERLDALAADIDALAGINSDVVFDGEEFHLEIKSDTNEALTFQGDTGGLIAALGIANRGDKVFSANIDGATDGSDDGSATVNGSTITATDQTGADGLMLFYNGTSDLSGATVDYTVGLASQINFAIDDILADDGLIESELTNLDGQNDLANDRINEMQLRLDMQREALLARFRRMETTLATAQNIMDSLKQTVDAAFNNNNNR
jgi:flagellar capping protein FliD